MLPKDKDYTWIPEGFVLVTGPDNEMYIVPDFMVPSLNQDYRSEKKKKRFKSNMCSWIGKHKFHVIWIQRHRVVVQ